MGITEKNEVTFADILVSIISWIKFLCSKWKYLIGAIVVGLIVGWVIYFFSQKKYVAECNFVLESTSQSASSIPFGLGLGIESSTGLFSSLDNIIWLYSSDKMLERALLSSTEANDGKQKVLINDLKGFSQPIKEYIEKNDKYKNIIFQPKQTDFTLEEAAFLKACIAIFRKEYLTIEKVNKTENIVKVKVKAEDEQFALNFTESLVAIVNDFYISTKTKKLKDNVDHLTAKADSLRQNLSMSMEETAIKLDNTPYPNPNLSVLKVEPQKGNVDVQANTGLYLQIIQNLESARNELNREMPIIQVVDTPRLPLPTSKLNLKLALVIGSLVFLFLTIFSITVVKVIRDVLKKNAKDKGNINYAL